MDFRASLLAMPKAKLDKTKMMIYHTTMMIPLSFLVVEAPDKTILFCSELTILPRVVIRESQTRKWDSPQIQLRKKMGWVQPFQVDPLSGRNVQANR